MPGPTIKSSPEDFVVDEIPSYAAQGTGPHTFLRIEKRLRTTEEVVRREDRTAHLVER